jgi:8-hydroxy-5-deazaflavin:NADPH oxidoreductase
MKIAIIGAGNVGRALSTALDRAGHQVTISSRDPEDAGAVASATGARAARSNTEAVQGAEVVILAVPFASIEDVAREISDAAGDKIVVDVTNAMGADGEPYVPDAGSAGEAVQGWLPRARVVKAFNTLIASTQLDPVVEDVQLDGFAAGDDEEARSTVLELMRSVGVRAIDAGPLRRARELEALAYLNIWLNIQNPSWGWRTGWKLLGVPRSESRRQETGAVARADG